jgi:heme O synthase-like polyprenyltransferase
MTIDINSMLPTNLDGQLKLIYYGYLFLVFSCIFVTYTLYDYKKKLDIYKQQNMFVFCTFYLFVSISIYLSMPLFKIAFPNIFNKFGL